MYKIYILLKINTLKYISLYFFLILFNYEYKQYY